MAFCVKMANKKFIQTAVVSAFLLASHSALADVKLYGLIDVFVGNKTKIGQEHSNNVVDNGGMTTSFLGMKGGEKLDGDLSVNFALEAFFRVDEGAIGRFNGDLPFARNAYLELKSESLGSIRLGRNTTPFFVSTILYNPFGGSYNFSPAIMNTYTGNGYLSGKESISGLIGDSGWSNSIIYNTPSNLGGFSASMMYALAETGSDSAEDKWSVGLGYRAGNFASSAVFQQVKLDPKPSFANKFIKGFVRQDAAILGLSYDFQVVKLFGQYEYIHNRIQDGDTFSNGGQVGVSIPAGGGKILTSYMYTRTKGNKDFKNLDRHAVGVGYNYPLSKRTDVYGAYYYDKITDLSKGQTFGVGIQTRY